MERHPQPRETEGSPSPVVREYNGYLVDESDRLGVGAYGVVHRARDLRTNAHVAFKRVTLSDSSESDGVPCATIREALVLRRATHPNIVQLIDVFECDGYMCVVMELCSGGDLAYVMQCLQRNRIGDHLLLVHYALQLFSGLAYLHTRHITHQDLKPSNLFLNGDWSQLKLGDFGLSREEFMPIKKYSHQVLTLWYRPPDLIMGNPVYGYTADMWAAGCVLAEMASGAALMQSSGEDDQLPTIFSQLGVPTKTQFPSMESYPFYAARRPTFSQFAEQYEAEPSNPAADRGDKGFARCVHHLTAFFQRMNATDIIGNDGIDLIARLLSYEPDDRITAEAALQHPFFTAITKGDTPVLNPSSIIPHPPPRKT